MFAPEKSGCLRNWGKLAKFASLLRTWLACRARQAFLYSRKKYTYTLGRHPLRKLLFPFSILYGLFMQLRNMAYTRGWKKRYRAEVPVISVGNISTGGTGKTPVAEYLLALCAAQGIRAAYLSRGYGRRSRGYLLVPPQAVAAVRYGDEALQVARKFPNMAVAVCEDRRQGIRQLLATYQPRLIILDDAFQHRKVQRELDLLVIDANRLPTQDLVLPAGNLREFRSGLKRADLLIVNKLSSPAQIPAIRQALARYGRPLCFCRPVQLGIYHWEGRLLHAPGDFPGLAAVVFSGIGNNDFFVQQLAAAGIRVLATQAYRDHYRYRSADLEALCRLYERWQHEQPLLLTTEKDRCRLLPLLEGERFGQLPFAYTAMGLEWLEGAHLLSGRLEALIKGRE